MTDIVLNGSTLFLGKKKAINSEGHVRDDHCIDQIEDVTASTLETLVENQDYVAVFFCK